LIRKKTEKKGATHEKSNTNRTKKEGKTDPTGKGIDRGCEDESGLDSFSLR